MKKLLAILLTLTMVFCMSPLTAFAYSDGIPDDVIDSQAELVAAINNADGPTTITLGGNVALSSGLAIGATKNITIDLNGYILSAVFSNASTTAAITNDGILTIQDSSPAQTGKLTNEALNPDTNWEPEGFPTYANNTITNHGTLTVLSGTIDNVTVGGAAYAIDNYSNHYNASLYVSGGTISNSVNGNHAVRVCMGNPSNTNTVVITGGNFIGKRAIWIHLSGSDPSRHATLNMSITGGTFTATDTATNRAIYCYSYGDSFEGVNISISGGTFNGDISMTSCALDNIPTGENISITGGIFNGPIGFYSYREDLVQGVISGGTFAVAPAASYLAPGLSAVYLGGSYVIGDPNVLFPPVPETPPVSSDGSTGWDEIVNQIQPTTEPTTEATTEPKSETATDEETTEAPAEPTTEAPAEPTTEARKEVVIQMKDSTTVPAEVVKAVAESEATVTFKTSDATWKVESEDVPADAGALNLKVETNTEPPAEAEEIAAVSDKTVSVKVDDSFATNGVKATLKVDTGRDTLGKVANVYVKNEDGELELRTSVPVNRDGSVSVPVESAAEYVVAVADEGATPDGWSQNDLGEWRYGEDGLPSTGWIHDGEAWYHLAEDGDMNTGWVKDGGEWYYLRDHGAMASGWVKDGDTWYHMSGSGAMNANRWIKHGDEWYYVGADGAMLTNTTTPDGYKVDADGKWIR